MFGRRTVDALSVWTLEPEPDRFVAPGQGEVSCRDVRFLRLSPTVSFDPTLPFGRVSRPAYEFEDQSLRLSDVI